MKRGLPYRWWESATFWDVVILIILTVMLTGVVLAYLFGWDLPCFT